MNWSTIYATVSDRGTAAVFDNLWYWTVSDYLTNRSPAWFELEVHIKQFHIYHYQNEFSFCFDLNVSSIYQCFFSWERFRACLAMVSLPTCSWRAKIIWTTSKWETGRLMKIHASDFSFIPLVKNRTLGISSWQINDQIFTRSLRPTESTNRKVLFRRTNEKDHKVESF